MSGTYCSVVDEGKPATADDLFFGTVAEALADRQRLADEAAASAPPLIEEECRERLDFYLALPGSTEEKDAAFYLRFPDALEGP